MAWVREAAASRFDALELNDYVYAVEATEDRQAAAQRLAGTFALSADEVVASPHALIGSVEGMVEELRERRERYGISHVTVGEDLMDALAPVVARLAGR